MKEQLSTKGSLFKRIILLVVLAIYLPLLLIVWLLGDWLSQTQMEQAEAMLKASLRQSTINMNAEIQFIEQLTYSYATDHRISYFANKDYLATNEIALQLEAHEYLQDRLWAPEPSRLSLKRVILFSDNDGLWMSGSYLYPYAWLTEEAAAQIAAHRSTGWWATPKHQLLVNSGLIHSLLTGYETSLFFNRTVVRETSEYNMVISLQMPLSVLTQYLSNTTGACQLMTMAGEVLASSGELIWEGDPKTLADHVLAGEERFILTDKGNKTLVNVLPLRNGWRLMHALPYEVLLNDTMHARLLAIGLALLMGLLFLVLLGILWRVIIRRMRKLLEKMQLIQEGDFAAVSSLPQIALKNPDELSTLDGKLTTVASTLNTLIRENYELMIQRKDLELCALQAQINPHFLYNTLSTIKWMTLSHSDEEIRDVVDAMSNFYRISLSNGKEIITLAEELRCTKAYLTIQRFRTIGRIQVHFDVDESLMDLAIPKLILQPLVENSIVHGPVEQGLMMLLVRIHRRDGNIELAVTDDGRGMNPSKARELLSNVPQKSTAEGGYGLYNVYERLKLFYGDSVMMDVLAEEGSGVTVKIIIPMGAVNQSE